MTCASPERLAAGVDRMKLTSCLLDSANLGHWVGHRPASGTRDGNAYLAGSAAARERRDSL